MASVHSRSSLWPPSGVLCSISTMTRRTPETRSIAPPMPLTRLPGIIQLARSPRSDTCIAPRIARSMWPPRIIANESALENVDAPGTNVTVSLPALIRSASISDSQRVRPHAKQAVLRLQRDRHSLRNVIGNQRRNADAEVDIVAILQFLCGARSHLVASPGHRLNPLSWSSSRSA